MDRAIKCYALAAFLFVSTSALAQIDTSQGRTNVNYPNGNTSQMPDGKQYNRNDSMKTNPNNSNGIPGNLNDTSRSKSKYKNPVQPTSPISPVSPNDTGGTYQKSKKDTLF
jgi:hypothetical protein